MLNSKYIYSSLKQIYVSFFATIYLMNVDPPGT